MWVVTDLKHQGVMQEIFVAEPAQKETTLISNIISFIAIVLFSWHCLLLVMHPAVNVTFVLSYTQS